MNIINLLKYYERETIFFTHNMMKYVMERPYVPPRRVIQLIDKCQEVSDLINKISPGRGI